MKKLFYFVTFSFIWLFGAIVSLLPYKVLHKLGRVSGLVLYYLHRPFRKKAMANLAIAFGKTKSEDERVALAKESFQNLTMTCLEFFHLKASRGRLSEIVTLEGGEEVLALLKKGQGVIFLTGHQGNWEIPFIAVTAKHRGIAIGRPIYNPWLYRFILSVREMNGGKIVMPKNAIKASMKALKEGEFVGIVGDQAYPESPYNYPLFGVRAWTASTPALLAYKTNSPIVVGMTKREGDRLVVRGSHPIWPNLAAPRDTEVNRLMDEAMGVLEKSILENPGQWMWQHDRWKQQGIDHVKRIYRYGFILIVLPPNPGTLLSAMHTLKEIYPRSFLTVFAPHGTQIEGMEVIYYHSESELFVRDYRYQLVIDLYGLPDLRRHFLQLGAVEAISREEVLKNEGATWEEKLTITLCKPECLPLASS